MPAFGVYERGFEDEEVYQTFRYQVVRVWQLPPGPLLSGGLALLPLAPICAVTEAELPGIIQEMKQRLRSSHGRRLSPLLWGSAYILLGLRHSPALAAELFRGVLSMRDSSTYQAILAEGLAEGQTKGRTEGERLGAVAEAKKVLRLQGDAAFGVPDARTAGRIERIKDLPRLEAMLTRIRSAASWQELLGPSASGRESGRRR